MGNWRSLLADDIDDAERQVIIRTEWLRLAVARLEALRLARKEGR